MDETHQMKIMTQTVYDGGRKYPLNWELITTKRWSLSWHPHTKECRYGWYHNRTLAGGGLWMQLNLPLLGDFGLWQHWQPSASVQNGESRDRTPNA
jgi:hypothetical protein